MSKAELFFVDGPELAIDHSDFAFRFLGAEALKSRKCDGVDFESDYSVRAMASELGLDMIGASEDDLNKVTDWIRQVGKLGGSFFNSMRAYVSLDANDGTGLGRAAYFHSHHQRRLITPFDNQRTAPTLIAPGLSSHVVYSKQEKISELSRTMAKSSLDAVVQVRQDNYMKFAKAAEKIEAAVEQYMDLIFGRWDVADTSAPSGVYSAPEKVMLFSSEPLISKERLPEDFMNSYFTKASMYSHSEHPNMGQPRMLLVIDYLR